MGEEDEEEEEDVGQVKRGMWKIWGVSVDVRASVAFSRLGSLSGISSASDGCVELSTGCLPPFIINSSTGPVLTCSSPPREQEEKRDHSSTPASSKSLVSGSGQSEIVDSPLHSRCVYNIK